MTCLSHRFTLGVVAFCCLLASPAVAHVTFETKQAPVNASYKAALRVPHGCGGSPTLKIRVRIPDGVIAVKPMPKAGWTVDTVKGAYDKPYDYYGTPMREGVKEIVWSGRLADEHYDEFVFQGYLSGGLKPHTMLYFPTVQECETGAERWIEIPVEGKNPDSYKYPAPGLRLLPARATD
jgi:uncharacterized protein YcnI